MDVLHAAGQALTTLRARRPLIHQITNVVTVNDCANATLAIGASPTMTWAPEEVEDMARAGAQLRYPPAVDADVHAARRQGCR